MPTTESVSVKNLFTNLAIFWLFAFCALFAAVLKSSVVLYMFSAFLFFSSILTIPDFLVRWQFQRSVKTHRKSSKELLIPTVETMRETNNHELDPRYPVFTIVNYDLNNMPPLSAEAEQQWERIQSRLVSVNRSSPWYLLLSVGFVWVVFFSSLVVFDYQNIFLNNYVFFTLLTIIYVLWCLVAHWVSSLRSTPEVGKSVKALAIPEILRVVWLALPFLEGIRLVLEEGIGEQMPQMLFLWVGGSLAIALVSKIREIADRKYRHSIRIIAPAKLLFLWVFGTNVAAELFSNFGFKWQFLGPVYFLNGKGMMYTDSIKILFKMLKREKLLVTTEQDVDDIRRECSDQPNRYGHYDMKAVLCGDGIWKSILDDFFESKDLVLMSLCGYTESNKGCEFEIEKILNEVPTEKFVFLVNERTDMKELELDLQYFWSRMSDRSPNVRVQPGPVKIYKLNTLLSDDEDAGNTDEKAKRVRSIARAIALHKEGNQIVRLLCQAHVQNVMV